MFSASDYLWSGSMGLLSLAGYLTMVCFFAFFLLLADDMFKRKLVRHASSTLAGRKITVTVLESIGRQIEQFLHGPHLHEHPGRRGDGGRAAGGWASRTPRCGAWSRA